MFNLLFYTYKGTIWHNRQAGYGIGEQITDDVTPFLLFYEYPFVFYIPEIDANGENASVTFKYEVSSVVCYFGGIFL